MSGLSDQVYHAIIQFPKTKAILKGIKNAQNRQTRSLLLASRFSLSSARSTTTREHRPLVVNAFPTPGASSLFSDRPSIRILRLGSHTLIPRLRLTSLTQKDAT